VSVNPPVVAVVFGSVVPPQGDVVELRAHLGCTREVSSFEVLLQNWGGKYSPNSATPISVGVDGSISLGRGADCPLLMTCRVESVKYESTPVESYVHISGRCWGERLFRRVVTKTYENKKGDEIVKDLLDYYVGLSHVRGGTELVEATDTTYTRLEYQDTPVIGILQYVAGSADKAGVIGYDFRVAPDGKFEFFPRNSKASSVSLTEKIEQSEYGREIHRVRNRVTVYGVADKSVPLDKDAWTESLTPSDGAWTSTSGTVSFDTTVKVKGSGSFWVDGLFFGGRRYSTTQEDAGSQSSYGLRELVEVDEELWSDAECTSRAQELLASLEDSAEQLTLRSTVIAYGTTPLLAGDNVHIELPNEGVDGDFCILNVEYHVDAKTQTLETTLELGREHPLLADYVFKLKSKTDSLSRYKLARP